LRVLVTGGTGFVGANTIAALVAAGHEVRLLARSVRRVPPALDPLAVPNAAYRSTEGDVTDPRSVERAVQSCDAVVHAAALYSYDPRDADAMLRTNVEGTETVLGAAVDAGADPIIHVSSHVALLPSDDDPATERTPVGDPPGPYASSKASADRVARRYQERGAPVVITYPGGVLGPDDPKLGETNAVIHEALERGVALTVRDGATPFCDVRDIAALHAAAMAPGLGPRRFLAGGPYTPLDQLFSRLADLTGRRIRTVEVPEPIAIGAGWVGDLGQKYLGTPSPGSREVAWTAARSVAHDLRHTRDELDVSFRSIDETLADTVRWLHRTGRISGRKAGILSRSKAAQ
jgi:dihydroflavonol-4-reductase